MNWLALCRDISDTGNLRLQCLIYNGCSPNMYLLTDEKKKDILQGGREDKIELSGH